MGEEKAIDRYTGGYFARGLCFSFCFLFFCLCLFLLFFFCYIWFRCGLSCPSTKIREKSCCCLLPPAEGGGGSGRDKSPFSSLASDGLVGYLGLALWCQGLSCAIGSVSILLLLKKTVGARHLYGSDWTCALWTVLDRTRPSVGFHFLFLFSLWLCCVCRGSFGSFASPPLSRLVTINVVRALSFSLGRSLQNGLQNGL